MKITFKRISQPVLYVFIDGFKYNYWELYRILWDIENTTCDLVVDNTFNILLIII